LCVYARLRVSACRSDRVLQDIGRCACSYALQVRHAANATLSPRPRASLATLSLSLSPANYRDHCSYGGDTQSGKLRKKLAQVSCTSFLHQIFVQVHASSADDTSNKNGRSWMKQITFSITCNFYLSNLNKFKK